MGARKLTQLRVDSAKLVKPKLVTLKKQTRG